MYKQNHVGEQAKKNPKPLKKSMGLKIKERQNYVWVCVCMLNC